MRRILTLLLMIIVVGAVGVLAQDEARPYLGIAFEPDGLSGVIVTDVAPDSPAEAAELAVDDVIVTMDDMPITAANLSDMVREYAVGDDVTLGMLRDGEPMRLTLTLAAAPEAAPEPEAVVVPSRTQLGVAVDFSEDDQGVNVINVVEGTAADEAGVEVGDVILSVDGQAVDSPTALAELIRGYAPGDTIEIELMRGEETLTLDVMLGEAAEMTIQPERGFNMPDAFGRTEIGLGLVFNPMDNTWVVESVDEGDVLDEAGLQAGDIITEVNGQPIEDPAQLFEIVNETLVSGSAEITVERDGDTFTLEVPTEVITAMLVALR